MAVEQLITNNIDLWTSTIKKKSATGRGSSKKIELYGIKKLRELILELAVRGKLVPQDPTDEPANELLKRIEAEKAQLIKDKKIKKTKKLPDISKQEKPYELPRNWEWAYNAKLFLLVKGKKPKFLSESILKYPYLDIEALDRNNINRYTDDEKCPISTENDLLVVCDGSRSGLVLDGKYGVIGSTLARIDTQEYLQPYIKLFFRQSFRHLNTSMKGAAIPHLDTKALREGFLALPPLSEQQRIVSKVDELMSLCDQLESQTESSLEAHETLVQVLLATLTDSKNSEELNKNWQRVSEYFDTLFTTEQSIDQLKQTILQLAVMGKLVSQNPNDEPASFLLEKIAEEKAQLIKDKKIKKQKPLPPISDEEKAFEIPKGWSCAYLQDLCSLITDGTHQTPKYVDEGKPFVSAQCVKPFKFMLDKCRYVSEEHYQGYIKNRKPNKGDVLLARVGAGIGEAALIDTDKEFAIYVSTGLLKPFNAAISSDFLVIWLNSPIGRRYSEVNTLGKGVSQGNLNLSLIRQFIVELPPITEQHRIVAKVDEFMVLCGQLKTYINDAQTTKLNLTDAIVDSSI